MRRLLLCEFGFAIVLTLYATVRAQAAPALEFVSGFPFGDTSNASIGWEFTTNAAVTVDALDAYGPTGDGSVRLYDASMTVLASAKITTSDPTEGAPIPFYSHAITPITLAANTTYFITQDFDAFTTLGFGNVTGLKTSSAITYIDVVISDTLGADPTTNPFEGRLDPIIYGANFDIVVPEPGSLALLIAGLGGLGGLGTLQRKRAR